MSTTSIFLKSALLEAEILHKLSFFAIKPLLYFTPGRFVSLVLEFVLVNASRDDLNLYKAESNLSNILE